MNHFFNEAARDEHLEHVAYYESCQIGLGARYLLAFDIAMKAICESPELISDLEFESDSESELY